MKKVKLIAIALCIAMLFTVAAACNKDKDSSADNSGSANTNSPGGSSPSGGTSSSPGGGTSSSPGGSGETGSGGGVTASGRDTLVMVASGDPGTLSPILFGGDYSTACGLMLEALWQPRKDGSIEWLLATGVDEMSPTQWIVHLREGVFFSNGDPFTADDVIFSINLHKEYSSTAGPRVQSVDETTTKKIDDYTIDLQLHDFHVVNYLVLAGCNIYDSKAYTTEQASNNPIGTGPYVLDEYVINSHLALKRNDNYWGEPPAIPNILYRVLGEPAQVVNALVLGEVDFARITASDFDFVSSLQGYTVVDRYLANWATVGFAVGKNSIFYQNVDARLAVAHALDPNAFLSISYNGRGRLMQSQTSKAVNDYQDRFDYMNEVYSIGYDVDLAKQLAQSSGLAGKTVRLAVNGSDQTLMGNAEIVQNMLLAIDVHVEINTYDSASMWALSYDPEAQYDMSCGAGFSANMIAADGLVNGVRYSPVLSAPGAWQGVERFMEICARAFNEPDKKTRDDIVYELMDLHAKACLNVALVDYPTANAWSDDIDLDSLQYNSGNMIRLQYVRFK